MASNLAQVPPAVEPPGLAHPRPADGAPACGRLRTPAIPFACAVCVVRPVRVWPRVKPAISRRSGGLATRFTLRPLPF